MPASDRTLLFVFAHPDDESYGVAGTIARYARQPGTRVAVATLTRGESSRHLETLGISPAELGRRRGDEVKAALRLLGCDEHYQYDYPDGGMRQVDPRAVEATVRDLVRRVRPDVLATFDITGISGHPDHNVVSASVTRVFVDERQERPRTAPRRLAYYGVRAEDIASWDRPIHVTKPENVHVVIDCRAYLELREKALYSHVSVIGDIERDNANGGLRREEECFTLYDETVDEPLDDLFANLPPREAAEDSSAEGKKQGLCHDGAGDQLS